MTRNEPPSWQSSPLEMDRDDRFDAVVVQSVLPSTIPALRGSPTRPHVIVVSSTPDSVLKAPALPFENENDRPIARPAPIEIGATESPFFQSTQSASQPLLVHTSPARTTTVATYTSGELEQALRRRRDWTPPPPNTTRHVHLDASIDGEAWSSSPNATARGIAGRDRANDANKVFQTLHDSFRYRKTDDPLPHPAAGSERTTAAAEAYLTRRKPLEPVCLSDTTYADKDASDNPKKKKTKAKARTITELAVAAYADADLSSLDADVTVGRAPSAMDLDDPSLPASDDAEFVGLYGRNLGLPTSRLRKLNKPATKRTAEPKPKRKPVTKKGPGKATGGGAGGPAKRPARPARRQPVLLSPRSALLASTAQDFLFGTSSQLVGDESPTFLRELQAAMQASNQDDGDSSSTEVSMVDLACRGGVTPPAAAARPKRLWAVGARGHDGNVAFENVIDLEEPVEFPEDPHEVLRAMAQQAAKEAEAAKEPPVQDPVSPSPRPSQKATTKAPPASRMKRSPTQEIASSGRRPPPGKDEQSWEAALPISKTQPPPQPPATVDQTRASTTVPPPERRRPDFGILTTAQLAGKVASYGFKPVRARRAMVALLEQCWDSSTGMMPPPMAQGPTQKTATARVSTKAKAAAKEDRVVLEIADSEESEGEAVLPAARPTREEACSQQNHEDTAPAPAPASVEGLEMTSTDEDGVPPPAATSTGSDAHVFRYITKAVTAARRTDDPAQPSWHEKMLMYDTIILETFTAWLNEEGLGAAGYDAGAEGAVSAWDVKRWCEAKSVCCTWRTNLHGKERKL